MRFQLVVALLVVAAACVGADPDSSSTPVEPPVAEAGVLVVEHEAGVVIIEHDAQPSEIDAAPITDAGADVVVLDPNAIRQISAGDQTSCAVTNAGSLYCWGINGSHQLGVDRSKALDCKRGPDSGTALGECNLPRKVALADVIEVSNGASHGCAIVKNGDVYCWGSNQAGELGHDPSLDTGPGCGGACSFTPTKVAGVPAARHVSAGGNYTCMTSLDGRAFCWGRNEHGRLGGGVLGNDAGLATPAEVHGLPLMENVSSGQEPSACARDQDGGVWCWGVNYFGQTGHAPGEAGDVACEYRGSTECAPSPAKVAIDQTTYSASLGASGCALVRQSVYCWGNGIHQGLPCDQATTPHPNPLPVAALPPSRDVQGEYEHLCALTTDGRVFCWGRDRFGNLGQGKRTTKTCGAFATNPVPTQVPGLSGIVAIAVGAHHTIALKSDGALVSWGFNTGAALGHLPGSADDLSDSTALDNYYNATPQPVAELPP